MSGTSEGGARAAATNKARYGSDFYVRIGQRGGKLGRTGGFYANRELAREAGRKGGSVRGIGKGRPKGLRHTEETRAKMRASQQARRYPLLADIGDFGDGFHEPTWMDKIMRRFK